MKNFYKNTKLSNALSFLTLFALLTIAFAPKAWAQTTVTCYPPNESYATGYTTTSSKTSGEMHTVSNGGVQGWMKFDVSAIPDDKAITSIVLHFYSTSSSNCYVKLTAAGLLDPATASASELYTAITTESPNYYTSTYISNLSTAGWKSFTLSASAINNLQSWGLADDYFTIGFYEYESSSYYLYAYGYDNADYKPYIVVTYENPTTISSTSEWDTFCSNVDGGNNYSGKVVRLDADITVSTMAGTTSGNAFRGIFDGNGHTLTFNKTTSESYCAPFRYANGATFRNLKVSGTISTSNQFAAGFVGQVTGNGCTFTNCVSNITIASSISGDGTHGGFVANIQNGTNNFNGCAFTGSITTSNNGTTNCGGFAGWCETNNSAKIFLTDCVFAPNSTDFTSGCQTFFRIRNNSSTYCGLTNCYYTQTFGDAQGTLAYKVSGDTNVTVDLDGTHYGMVTGGNPGVAYQGTAYVGGSQTAHLLLSYTGSGSVSEYSADHGTLSGSTTSGTNDAYTLTMEAYDTEISATVEQKPIRGSNGNYYTWEYFAAHPRDCGSTIYLEKDITVTTMVTGSSWSTGTGFTGTFDGQGHTITLAINTTSNEAGLFHYTYDATIQNLNLEGSIYSESNTVASLIGLSQGTTHIKNCHSNVTVRNADNQNGVAGFIGYVSNRVYFEGCSFTGSLEGTSSANNGGFVGRYTNGNTHSYTNCVFDPTSISENLTNGVTFDPYGSATYTNTYYIQPFGTAQGKQAYTITGGSNVTVAMSGTETEYGVSTIKAYKDGSTQLQGLVYNGTIYAGQSDEVSLNLSYTGSGALIGYVADLGTLSDGATTGTDDAYTLDMPSSNVVISAESDSPTLYDSDGNDMTWNQFVTNVNNGNTYSGKTVYLDEDITVNTMAGNSSYSFQGTFDGQGHTLNVGITGNQTQGQAPFQYINGATIKNLVVTGSVTATSGSYPHAAGLVGFAWAGTNTIENCAVHTNVTNNGSNVNSHIGGIVGHAKSSTVVLKGCVYDGLLTSSHCKGGLVGWADAATIQLTDCLFNGTVSTTGNFHPIGCCDNGSNIISNSSYVNNCYYYATNNISGQMTDSETNSIVKALTNKGKRARSITAGTNVTVANAGTATTYSYSGITGYGTGIKYNDVLYAGQSDNVSLTLNYSGSIPSGQELNGYTASNSGTVTFNGTSYTLTMPNNNTVINANVTAIKYHIARTESTTQMTWDQFAAKVYSGTTYSEQTIYLDEDITTPVTTMVGIDVESEYYSSATGSFQGIFDGQNHTITVSLTNGTAHDGGGYDGDFYFTAPFRYIYNATIQNLTVTGTITNQYRFAGGFVGYALGTNNITNCVSNVTISSIVNGDGTHGGFIALLRSGSCQITGCAFTGEMDMPDATYCGGFVGYSSGTCTISNCVFAPSDVDNCNNTCTFVRSSGVTSTITNCYYTRTFGTAQGKLMRSITGDTDITVEMRGTPTSYGVSGITAYSGSNGLLYNNTIISTIIAGASDVVNLALSGAEAGMTYISNYGTLEPSRTADNYVLTLPSGLPGDVVISACTTPEEPGFSPAAGSYNSSPQNVTLSCATSGATIYYTTDGSTPTDASTAYSSAISVTATTTIKAIAYNGQCHSDVVEATYIMPSNATAKAGSNITSVTVSYGSTTSTDNSMVTLNNIPPNTSVTFTAAFDDTEYEFKGWYDSDNNIVSNNATYTFNITADVTLTAYATSTGSSCDDFEDGSLPEGWTLVNGTITNHWTIGSSFGAAATDGGSYALYITDTYEDEDYGYNNYSNADAMVYAYKTIELDDAFYNFKYDWRANGETNWDYLRVALVPGDVDFNAGTSAPPVPSGSFYNNLPTDWIALDRGAQLEGKTSWQSVTENVIEVTHGTYKLVFAWRNDGSGGNNPPAAIDNVCVEKLTSYEISYVSNDTDKGTVSGSTHAFEGFTVTPVITPAAGYKLGSLIVTKDSDGSNVTVTNNSFTMPADDVTVTAHFAYDICNNEDFSNVEAAAYNNDGSAPSGWTVYKSSHSSAHLPHVSTYNNWFGDNNNYLFFNGYGNNVAIMPKYNNIKGVSFEYRYESTSYGTLEVGYVTDIADTTTFVSLVVLTKTTDVTNYTLSSSNVEAINNNDGYIAFRWYYTGNWYAGIDNIEVCLSNLWTERVASVPDSFDGTQNPIEITCEEDLAWFISYVNGYNSQEKHPNANAKLMADVNMEDLVWVPIGINSSTKYTGTFDGNYHTINGVHIADADEVTDVESSTSGTNGTMQYTGLFGYLDGSAVIKNVMLINSSLSNSYSPSGVGYKGMLGGIVGYAGSNTSVEMCETAVTLTALANISTMGGVAGMIDGEVKGCMSMSQLNFGNYYIEGGVGGVVGYGYGSANDCFANSIISGTGETPTGAVAGGMSTVGNLYAHPSATGSTKVHAGSSPNKCYAPASGYLSGYNNTFTAVNYTYGQQNNLITGTGSRMVDTLNRSVSTGFKWVRPSTSHINNGYPIVVRSNDADLMAVVGISGDKKLYFGEANAMIDKYKDNENAHIYVYNNGMLTTKPTANKAKLFIDEHASIKLSEVSGVKATVGVTIDNSANNGEMHRDWHCFATPLSDAPLGITYSGDAQWHADTATVQGYMSFNGGYFPSALALPKSDMDFYDFSEPDYHWINLKRSPSSHYHEDGGTEITYDDNEGILKQGNGYLLAIGGNTAAKKSVYLSTEGTLTDGDVTATVTNKGDHLKGYNFLGNPYQSYLDFHAFVTEENESHEIVDNSNAKALWSGTGAIGHRAYLIYDADEGYFIEYLMDQQGVSFSEGSYDKKASRYIHPHQAFFVVKNSTTTNNEATVTFTNGMRNIEPATESSFRDEVRPTYPLVNLICTDDNGKREVSIIEVERPSMAGALKMKDMLNGKANMYIHWGEEDFSSMFLEGTPEYVPVWFKVAEQGVFTMSWSTANDNFGYLHLVDNLTGADIDCLSTDSYTFQGKPSDMKARFRLVFSALGIEEETETEQGENFAFIVGNELVVTGEGELSFIDLNGRILATEYVHGVQSHIAMPKVAEGMYMLRLTNGNGVKVQKIVVRR